MCTIASSLYNEWGISGWYGTQTRLIYTGKAVEHRREHKETRDYQNPTALSLAAKNDNTQCMKCISNWASQNMKCMVAVNVPLWNSLLLQKAQKVAKCHQRSAAAFVGDAQVCDTAIFGWPTSLSESNKDRKINWPETRVWCLNNPLPQNPSKSDFIWIISTAFFIKGAWRRLGALQYTGNEAAAGAEERVYLAGLIESSTVVSSSSSNVRAAH